MREQLFQRIRDSYAPFSDSEAAIIFGGIVILLSFAGIIVSGIIGGPAYLIARIFFGLGVGMAVLGVVTQHHETLSEVQDRAE